MGGVEGGEPHPARISQVKKRHTTLQFPHNTPLVTNITESLPVAAITVESNTDKKVKSWKEVTLATFITTLLCLQIAPKLAQPPKQFVKHLVNDTILGQIMSFTL